MLSPIYEGKMLGYFEKFNKIQILRVALFLVILGIIIEIVTNLWSRTVLKLNGKVSAQRVFDIIMYKSFSKETYGDLNIENIKCSIEFKNVKFKYDSNSLFENLNFKINCNKMVAIVGKSGRGKSIILKLINKSYSVNDGEILIDNYNINLYRKKQ